MSDYPTEEAYLAVCLADRIKRERIEELEAALRLMNITADHLSAQNQNYKEQITALVKEKHRREE